MSRSSSDLPAVRVVTIDEPSAIFWGHVRCGIFSLRDVTRISLGFVAAFWPLLAPVGLGLAIIFSATF